VLLGHTLDDQAETVLLGLARGSGTRSLAGMPASRGILRRPLLGLRRRTVRSALPALLADGLPDGLPAGLPWEDPANDDARHPRVRVRHHLLPALEAALGEGSVVALARSADLLRADADALDTLAREAVADIPDGPVRTSDLAAHPDAVLARVLRLLAARAGAGTLTAAHTRALVDLARGDSGAGPVALPGGVAARRARGRLLLGPGDPPVGSAPAAPADPKEQ
jgi:tRNA(Ile)-lysidine synthase